MYLWAKPAFALHKSGIFGGVVVVGDGIGRENCSGAKVRSHGRERLSPMEPRLRQTIRCNVALSQPLVVATAMRKEEIGFVVVKIDVGIGVMLRLLKKAGIHLSGVAGREKPERIARIKLAIAPIRYFNGYLLAAMHHLEARAGHRPTNQPSLYQLRVADPIDALSLRNADPDVVARKIYPF